MQDKKLIPLVSIIMNARNSSSYISQSINSVINQSYDNWELIVFDNNSNDNTALIVTDFNDSRIKLHHAKKDFKLGEARNIAISFASGEYICFLDTDDLWERNKISDQITIFMQSPELSMVYGNCWIIDSSNLRLRKYNKKAPSGNIFNSLLAKNFINLQTVMIRKNSNIIGGLLLRDDLEVAEEYELFLRLCYNNKVSYIDYPIASYRVHSEMTSIISNHKFIEELQLILNILPTYIKDFNLNYSSSIKKLRFGIFYKEYKALRINSNYIRGFKLVLKNLTTFYQAFALIPTLFMTTNLFIKIENLIKKYI